MWMADIPDHLSRQKEQEAEACSEVLTPEDRTSNCDQRSSSVCQLSTDVDALYDY